MTNYICINGKKAELTEEQLKALGIELPKANPFERTKRFDPYYMIMGNGEIDKVYEHNVPPNGQHYDVANYCTDKSIMQQRALYEILNRLLWRFSMTHKEKGEIPHEIYYDYKEKEWRCFNPSENYNYLVPRFDSCKIAQRAIEEIVKPFIKSHPEFKL